MQEEQIQTIQRAIKEGGAEAAKNLVTMDMLKGYKIAGSPEECSQIFRSLVEEHHLDVYILNIVAGGFKKNLENMQNVHKILKDSGCLAA